MSSLRLWLFVLHVGQRSFPDAVANRFRQDVHLTMRRTIVTNAVDVIMIQVFVEAVWWCNALPFTFMQRFSWLI